MGPQQKCKSQEAPPPRTEMWDRLHETDPTPVPWYRQRCFCAVVLGLAAVFFTFGFLLGRFGLATHTPERTRRTTLCGTCGPTTTWGLREGGLFRWKVGMGPGELGEVAWSGQSIVGRSPRVMGRKERP